MSVDVQPQKFAGTKRTFNPLWLPVLRPLLKLFWGQLLPFLFPPPAPRPGGGGVPASFLPDFEIVGLDGIEPSCAPYKGAALPLSYRPSALHAHNLFDLRHDFYEVGLIRHYLVNVFVGAWNFVKDSRVFPALDPRRLLLQIFYRETPLGL